MHPAHPAHPAHLADDPADIQGGMASPVDRTETLHPPNSGAAEGSDVEMPEENQCDEEDLVMGTLGFIGSLEPSFDDSIAELMLQQMGYGKSFVRERRKGVNKLMSPSTPVAPVNAPERNHTPKAIVSEIYSLPRIMK